jgi:hypothetical protein
MAKVGLQHLELPERFATDHPLHDANFRDVEILSNTKLLELENTKVDYDPNVEALVQASARQGCESLAARFVAVLPIGPQAAVRVSRDHVSYGTLRQL